MALRNFWIELDVDGRKTPIATGPSRKDGGFSLDVHMRYHGDSLHVLTVEGQVDPDGALRLFVVDPVKGEVILARARER